MLVCAALLLSPSISLAANISWGAPAKISADTDVSLNGALVRAINATPTNTTLAIDVTLNGVTFVSAGKTGTASYTAPGGDVFVPIDTSAVGPGTFQAFAQGSVVPITTLSTSYSNMLATAYWNDGTDIGNTWALSTGYNWTLNNLTIGMTYELQIWANDSRLSNLSQNNPDLFTTFMDLNGNSVSLQHNVDDFLGGVGQFVIGTFTADSTSQPLKFTGGNTVGADTSGNNATSLLNAYQLRAVSPASAPVFTNVMRFGADLILQGTNGPPNGAYQMLRSPDVTAPLDGDDWSGIGIQNFDANGNFSFTTLRPAADPANFYRVLVIASGPVSPPSITSQPQDLAISVGQDGVFNVTATGTVPLTYRWYFNTNTLLASGAQPTLTINNARLTNSGKISVTISNLVGVTNSVFATLTVTNSTVPPFITAQPLNATVTAGQTANFPVTAGGALPLRYQWFFNTNTVLLNETNSTLTLLSVQTNQAGKYSVTVTNLYGTTNSVFATLTVNPPGTGPDFSLIGWATQADGTTGGAGAGTGTVSTASAFTAAVQSTTTSNILVSGMIDLAGATVNPKSNKSIIGIGTNAGVIGTISLSSVSNIIVRNLTIMTPPGVDGRDGMNTTQAHHVWVDHCSFEECTDGQFDITHGSDYFTVSWCKFSYTNAANTHRLSMLIGNRDDTGAEDLGHLKVTLHHNWYSTLVNQRMPRVRFGEVHIFNSYYNAPGNVYCIGLGCTAHVLLESSYFEGVNTPWRYQGYSDPSCVDGVIHWNNDNVFVNAAMPADVPNSTAFTPPYPYTLDGGASVKSTVTNYAGVGKGPFAP